MITYFGIFLIKIPLDKLLWSTSWGWSNAIASSAKVRSGSKCCLWSGKLQWLWYDWKMHWKLFLCQFVISFWYSNCSIGSCISRVAYHQYICGIWMQDLPESFLSKRPAMGPRKSKVSLDLQNQQWKDANDVFFGI